MLCVRLLRGSVPDSTSLHSEGWGAGSEVDVVAEDSLLRDIEIGQCDPQLDGLVQAGEVGAREAEVSAQGASDGGEQRGLPAAVLADDQDRPSAQVEIELSEGTKVAEFYASNLHASSSST